MGDPGLDGHDICHRCASVVTVHQNLRPCIRCYVIGKEAGVLGLYRSRGVDTAGCQYFASEYVYGALIGIYAHLVIVDQLRAPHLAGVVADLHPIACPGVVQIKVALDVVRRPYGVVQVAAQHEYVFADGIKDHFVAGSGCGSVAQLRPLAHQRPVVVVDVVHPKVAEILVAIPASVQIYQALLGIDHQLMTTAIA